MNWYGEGLREKTRHHSYRAIAAKNNVNKSAYVRNENKRKRRDDPEHCVNDLPVTRQKYAY